METTLEQLLANYETIQAQLNSVKVQLDAFVADLQANGWSADVTALSLAIAGLPSYQDIRLTDESYMAQQAIYNASQPFVPPS